MARPTSGPGAPGGSAMPNLRNPFTAGSTSPARQHANANAAFMRAVRPGSAADAGGQGNHPFDTTGEPHPFDGAHPDASLFPAA